MNPSKVIREQVRQLTDLPNMGPAGAADLALLGITTPFQLVGRCPYKLYEDLCTRTGVVHDPCVLDVFIAAIRFMDGEPPRPWWHFTQERKRRLDRSGATPSGLEA